MRLFVKSFKKIIAVSCMLGCFLLVGISFAQEPVFIGNFQNAALAIDEPDVGPIIGETDIEVRHPFWVSSRPAGAPPRDSSDPGNISEAWTTDTFTNMKDVKGNLVPGATVHQEWIGVSAEEAKTLSDNGFALIGSSGGFIFGLIKQEVSAEATEAFGLESIDTGEFIRASETLQGICG